MMIRKDKRHWKNENSRNEWIENERERKKHRKKIRLSLIWKLIIPELDKADSQLFNKTKSKKWVFNLLIKIKTYLTGN